MSESGGEEGERVAGGASPQAADGSNPRIEAARSSEEVSESSVIVTVPPPSKRTTPHKPVKINFSGNIFFSQAVFTFYSENFETTFFFLIYSKNMIS